MNPQQNGSVDDELNEGLAESVKKAQSQSPRTLFPTVPSGIGVPPKPQPPAPKEKSLAVLGISRGGIVRNASTVVKTQLDNPVANPKKVATGKSSILDRPDSDLTPEFGVPTLMSGMDANLEERAKEKAQLVLPAAPAAAEPAPQKKLITGQSTLTELIAAARSNNGKLTIGTKQFTLDLEIHQPF